MIWKVVEAAVGETTYRSRDELFADLEGGADWVGVHEHRHLIEGGVPIHVGPVVVDLLLATR